MIAEMFKWLLVLILLPCSRSYSISYKNEACTGVEHSWQELEFHCPSDRNKEFSLRLTVRVSAWWTLECYEKPSWSDIEVEPGELQYEVSRLEISGCPFPDITFGKIIEKLRLSSVSNLTFSSHMNLGSIMAQQRVFDMPKIGYLSLAWNGLTELPPDLLQKFGVTNAVDLSSNKIATLPYDFFQEIPDLWRIDLSHNAITQIDERLFGNCVSLEHVNLKGNLITTLSRHMFDGTRISFFDVAENQLETLPKQVFESARTLTLNISANKFALLPEKLFERIMVADVILTDNVGNLTTLPTFFFNNSTVLGMVVLARNGLSVLPATIFWGSFRLKHIDLHGNAFSSMPEDIFRDSRELVFLDLSGNELTSLPDNLFRNLRKLRELNLESNAITSISDKLFLELSSLLDLNLGSNEISTIEWTAFKDLVNLRVARLSHNLVDLEDLHLLRLRHFHECTNLQKIFLDHNNLTGLFRIEELQSQIPASLKFVDLTYNYINNVLVTSPKSGSQNIVYDFRHNKIRAIRLMEEVDTKVRLLVDDNQIECGCSIYPLLGYMNTNRQSRYQENLEIIPGNAICSGPSWITNKFVADLQVDTFTCRPDEDYRLAYCSPKCDCWWIPHNTTRLVNCTSRNLEEVPQHLIEFLDEEDEEVESVLGQIIDGRNQWFHWQKSPVKLDLTDNSLAEIPPFNVSGYEYVDTLVLSRNNISKLSFDVLPPKLKVLDLDHNDLGRFDRVAWNALINSATLKKLNFEGNPWSCDSDTRRALESMEDQLGRNLRYSTEKCLDYRNPPKIKKRSTLYISYTIF